MKFLEHVNRKLDVLLWWYNRTRSGSVGNMETLSHENNFVTFWKQILVLFFICTVNCWLMNTWNLTTIIACTFDQSFAKRRLGCVSRSIGQFVIAGRINKTNQLTIQYKFEVNDRIRDMMTSFDDRPNWDQVGPTMHYSYTAWLRRLSWKTSSSVVFTPCPILCSILGWCS